MTIPTFPDLYAAISSARINGNEAAAIMNVSRQSLEKWIKGGTMRKSKRIRAGHAITAIKAYLKMDVLPARDVATRKAAVAKVIERVEERCATSPRPARAPIHGQR